MDQIFEILEQNAKATPEQIATMVGIPVGQVEKVIKQAEKDGTIVKYKTIINWAQLGKEEIWALIEVKIAPQRDVGFDVIAERIYQFPQVFSAYLVSGAYDLAVLVKGESMREISSFVTERLSPLESVQNTVTHFLLKRYKENGEIFRHSLDNKRLPITP